MFRIEISGATPEEFAKNFKHMIGIFLPVIQKAEPYTGSGSTPAAEVQSKVPFGPAVPVEGEIIPPKKEKKAAKPKPEQIDIEQTIAETPPSDDDTRKKLKAVGDRANSVVWHILKKHECRNVKDMPIEKRALVIADCDKALALPEDKFTALVAKLEAEEKARQAAEEKAE
jgi:hypothetical protein